MDRPEARPAEPDQRRAWRVWIGANDKLRWITIATGAGLATAVVLAVIGGFPFDVPMPTHSVGWVEPTCGLTRGSTAIARGDLGLAWRYNPAAFLVMGFGAFGLVRTAIGVTTHQWVNATWRFNRIALIALAGAFLALWIYQQQNADFIIHSRT